jgi:hypothetical protein
VRTAQVLGVAVALVVAGGVGDAVAGSKATHVTACVDSHSRLVAAVGHHCGRGSHAVKLATSAAVGPRGLPGPFPTVVPSGQTLTGVWVLSAEATAAAQYTNETVSFDYPFRVAPQPEMVSASHNDDPAHCKGTVTNPSAAKGYLCIYFTSSNHIGSITPYSPITNQIYQATRFGWGAYSASSGAGDAIANGTWAATAK